jgi:hypothetical protein
MHLPEAQTGEDCRGISRVGVNSPSWNDWHTFQFSHIALLSCKLIPSSEYMHSIYREMCWWVCSLNLASNFCRRVRFYFVDVNQVSQAVVKRGNISVRQQILEFIHKVVFDLK